MHPDDPQAIARTNAYRPKERTKRDIFGRKIKEKTPTVTKTYPIQPPRSPLTPIKPPRPAKPPAPAKPVKTAWGSVVTPAPIATDKKRRHISELEKCRQEELADIWIKKLWKMDRTLYVVGCVIEEVLRLRDEQEREGAEGWSRSRERVIEECEKWLKASLRWFGEEELEEVFLGAERVG